MLDLQLARVKDLVSPTKMDDNVGSICKSSPSHVINGVRSIYTSFFRDSRICVDFGEDLDL